MTIDDDLRTELARLQEDKAALSRGFRDLLARMQEEKAALKLELGRSAQGTLASRGLAALKEAQNRAETAERQLAEEQASHKRAFDLACHHQDRAEAAERQLAEMRAALERIGGSRLHDFTTLHPEACSRIAREALAALQDRAPAGIHGAQPSLMVLEQSETTDGLQALTIRWPGGKETVELMSLRVADALQDRVPSEQDGGRNDR